MSTRNRPIRPRRALPLPLPLLMLAAVSGCVTPGGGAGPELAPAALPAYHAGDVFRYDDGREERVVAVDGDRATWETGPAFTFERSANPVMPNRVWWSATRTGTLSDLSAPETALWPLRVGNGRWFHYRYTVAARDAPDDKTFSYNQDCAVTGTQALSGPLGTFDTYVLRCHRYSRTQAFRGTRTWYYAPALGHVMMYVDTPSRANGRVRQLTAVRPSLADLAPAHRAAWSDTVQRVLETHPSGHDGAWRGPGPWRATVRPLKTFRAKAGPYCRTYRVDMVTPDRLAPALETACRDDAGVWRRLEG
ncbi:MAG: hypothetical protein KDE22_10200 [Rhodobacterales bacterium]|nr:hypothetical protein [Rhodobacterales bacterium]